MVLFTTHMFIGGFFGFILDNTIPGKLESLYKESVLHPFLQSVSIWQIVQCTVQHGPEVVHFISYNNCSKVLLLTTLCNIISNTSGNVFIFCFYVTDENQVGMLVKSTVRLPYVFLFSLFVLVHHESNQLVCEKIPFTVSKPSTSNDNEYTPMTSLRSRDQQLLTHHGKC